MHGQIQTEQLAFLIGKGIEYFKNALVELVSSTGRIRPFRMRFHIPGTENKGFFIVESAEAGSPDDRYLQIGVCRDGTDRLTSNYLSRGTNQELIDYLSRAHLTEALANAFSLLSEKTDDYWD